MGAEQKQKKVTEQKQKRVIRNLSLVPKTKFTRHTCEFKVSEINGKHVVIEITSGEFEGGLTDSIPSDDPVLNLGVAEFYATKKNGLDYLQADTAFIKERNAINRVISTTSGGAIKSVQTLDQFSSLSASRQEALLKLTSVLGNKQSATPSGLVRKEVSEEASAELP